MTLHPDIQKLAQIISLIESLSPDFRKEVEAQLGIPPAEKEIPEPSRLVGMDGQPLDRPRGISKAAAGADPKLGLLDVNVAGNGSMVQVTFDRPLSVMAMRNAQALQLAAMIMEAAGAKIERVTTAPSGPVGPA
jgi:membrane-associated protease RseP (regulator of RpoE activity)